MADSMENMCLELNKYHVDTPYPEIKVERKNPKYANIILFNYASSVSELSAITQYIYHSFILEKEYPEVSQTLKGIAIVEMHHLDILANVTIALGTDPKYHYFKKHKSVNWTPKYVEYSKTPSEAVKDDISGEIDAIKQYQRAINEINDCNIVKIISRIIEDEEYHIDLLRGLQRKYSLV